MIYFRVDANETIATGHMMRCMTIANAMKKKGEEVTFLISDEESGRLLEDCAYSVMNLHTTWDDLSKELDDVKTILRQKQGILFIDTYSVTAEYVSQLKEYAVIVCMDDLFQTYLDADVIINYNIFYKRYPYEDRYKNKDIRLLLGSKYVPLREQFQRETNRTCGEVRRLLLISGGGDRHNFMGRFLRWTLEHPGYEDMEFYAVAGRMNPYIEELHQLESQNRNIKILTNVQNMRELMEQCDLAISAASTVLYECCASRLPTLFFISADDQEYDKEYFSEEEMMIYLGDLRKEEGIFRKIDEVMADKVMKKEVREAMCMKMGKVTDGFGAERIANELIKEKR